MANNARAQVLELCKTHEYRYRAYLSSGLTNVPREKLCELTSTLERLYLDVFHPLEVLLYLPHLWSDPGHNSEIFPEDVHILDRLRIAQSDFVVLCADYPSFGVGQEFEIAQAMGLRVLLYRQENITVSRMLLGGSAFHVPPGLDESMSSKSIIVYREYDDLRQQLMSRTAELLSCLPARQSRPPTPNFSGKLQEILRRKRCSAEQLAEETGFTVAFIRHLSSEQVSLYGMLDRWSLPMLKTEMDLTKYINPGLWVLRKISHALDIPISDLVEPDLVSSAKAQEDETRSRIYRGVRSFAAKRELTFRQYEILERHMGDLQAARSTGSDLETSIERLWNRIKVR